MKRMSNGKIQDLLKEVADEIRRRKTLDDYESEVLLTLAAVVEHTHPDMLRPRDESTKEGR